VQRRRAETKALLWSAVPWSMPCATATFSCSAQWTYPYIAGVKPMPRCDGLAGFHERHTRSGAKRPSPGARSVSSLARKKMRSPA
jgi:hypothetical protein